jgi:hypothetical protein
MGQDTRKRTVKALLAVFGLLAAMLVLMMACHKITVALNSGTDAPVEQALSDTDMVEALAQAQALADAAHRLHQPPPSTLEGVNGIVVDLIPQSWYTWGDEPLDQVTAIVIHYTGNPGTTAKQNRDYLALL